MDQDSHDGNQCAETLFEPLTNPHPVPQSPVLPGPSNRAQASDFRIERHNGNARRPASPQTPTIRFGFTSIIVAISETRRYDCNLSSCS